MGNSTSTEASDSSDSPLVTGVSISSKLQAKIVEEYNAKVHAEFMQRTQNRKQIEQANKQMESEHDKYLGQRKDVHDRLDQRISDLDAKFKDTLRATDYDASALHEKYCKGGEILGSEAPCAEVRNNYVSCQKNGNALDCEIFVTALQDCVSKTISG